MSKIFLIGLINVETNIHIGQFPINYSPIEFSFFKTKTNPSGVALNLAMAYKALGDNLLLCSMSSNDLLGEAIKDYLDNNKINYLIDDNLKETPLSTVLYDDSGKRKIYCDLKDCQDVVFNKEFDYDFDLACICNINFARPYLKKFKEKNIKIACDCHILSNIYDEFNHDFLVYSDILFISDEMIKDNYYSFMQELIKHYDKEIIVISRGEKGVLMYVKKDDNIIHLDAYPCINVVNTVGAGDSLFACFNHYYLKTNDPYLSIKKAMKYASIKIGYSGGSTGFMNADDFEVLFNE